MALPFDGRFQGPFFVQGEEVVEIMDEDHAVIKLHNSFHMLHAGKDCLGRDDVTCRPLDYLMYSVYRKGHGPLRRSGNDQVVAQPCSPFRKAEAAADVQDRHNLSIHGDDAENDVRRLR